MGRVEEQNGEETVLNVQRRASENVLFFNGAACPGAVRLHIIIPQKHSFVKKSWQLNHRTFGALRHVVWQIGKIKNALPKEYVLRAGITALTSSCNLRIFVSRMYKYTFQVLFMTNFLRHLVSKE